MVDRKRKILCYNYDEKFVRVHKCHEYKLFQIDVNSQHTLEDAPTKELPEVEEPNQYQGKQETGEPKASLEEAFISLHALSGISSPQTLKI